MSTAIIAPDSDVSHLLDTIAKITGDTPEKIASDVLSTALRGLAILRNKLVRFRSVPPPEWSKFVDALVAAEEARREEAERSEAESEKRRERDHIRYLNQKLASIDVTKLEVDNRNPSGFKNVYGYGKGFRAQVCRNGRARYLPTRTEPVLAAQDRFEWYQRYSLPYGEEAKTFTAVFKQMPGDPDHVLAEHRAMQAWMGGTGPSVTNEVVEEHLHNIRVARAVAEAAEEPSSRKGRPKKVLDVVSQRAGRVAWTDDRRIVIEHDDGTALSYMPLSRVTGYPGEPVAAGEKIGEIVGARAKVMVHAVPPPSKLRVTLSPPKASPIAEGSYLDIPTATERRATAAAAVVPIEPTPSAVDEEAAEALRALKARIREQKVESAKTLTEIESEKIEKVNEEQEEELYFSPEDIASIVDDVIAKEDEAAPVAEVEPAPIKPRFTLVKPATPPRPSAPVVDDEDDFWRR